MSRQELNNWILENGDLLLYLKRIYKKTDSAEKSLNYNKEFQVNGSHPDYCFISKDKITAAKLTKKQVLNVKNQKLNEAIKRNEFSILYDKNRLNA